MVIGQKNVYSKKVANTQPKWSLKKIHQLLILERQKHLDKRYGVAASDAKPQGFWQNKQNMIAESHKYSSRSEFRCGTSSAYRSAIDNG